MMTELAQPAVFAALCLVTGLCVGSFLNVVIHRLPRMMEREWQEQCAELRGAVFLFHRSCRAPRRAPLTNLTLAHLARRLPHAATRRPRRAQWQAHWPRYARRGWRASSRPLGRWGRQTSGRVSRAARVVAFLTFERWKASSAQVCVAAACLFSVPSIDTISLHPKTPQNHVGNASWSVILPWFRAYAVFSYFALCTLCASKTAL